MRLPITDDYRIASDVHSWSIQRRNIRRRNGGSVEEWKSIAWYGSLEAAVAGLGQHMLMTSEAEGFVEALTEVRRICAALSEALPTNFFVRTSSVGSESK